MAALAILFCPQPGRADEDTSPVCFLEVDASRMVVELEQGRLRQEQVTQYAMALQELEKQVGLLKEAMVLQSEQLEIARKTVQAYQQLLEVERQTCKAQVDAAKPSMIKTLFGTLGAVGIGVLLGILVL